MRNFTFEIQTVVVAADVIKGGAPSLASLCPYLQSIKELKISSFSSSSPPPPPPSSSSFSSSSPLALQSNANLRFLKGFLPVSSFLPLFPICSFAFINICFAQFRHLFFGRPISRLPGELLLYTSLTFLLLSILLT